MEEKSQGDPVTLQCFVFIGTISGAIEPAAIFQDRSAASLVGIQAADQNFGKAEAFAVRLHIFQHPGGIAFSAFRRADGVADMAAQGAQKIVQVVAPESCRQGGCLICGCTETVLREPCPPAESPLWYTAWYLQDTPSYHQTGEAVRSRPWNRCFPENRSGRRRVRRSIPPTVQLTSVHRSSLAFLRFRILDAEGLNGNGSHSLRLQRFVAVVGVDRCDFIYDFQAFCYFSESSVCAVQMRSSFVHDEELASCAVREHGTCHGENAWGVCEVVLKSVLGELTLDAVIRAAGACACRISALDHESRDDAVEDQAVIEAFFYQTDEVVYGVPYHGKSTKQDLLQKIQDFFVSQSRTMDLVKNLH